MLGKPVAHILAVPKVNTKSVVPFVGWPTEINKKSTVEQSCALALI